MIPVRSQWGHCKLSRCNGWIWSIEMRVHLQTPWNLPSPLTSNFQINSVLGGGWNHSGQGNHNSESVERTRAKSSKTTWILVSHKSNVLGLKRTINYKHGKEPAKMIPSNPKRNSIACTSGRITWKHADVTRQRFNIIWQGYYYIYIFV